MHQVSEAWGKITESELERLRARIGMERTGSSMLRRRPLHLGRGTIRRFALGSGDDNPLYLDHDYARRSPIGNLIAPPSLVGFLERVNGATEGFPGCHTIWRGAEYVWHRHLTEGRVFDSSTALVDARIVPSQFGGGQAAVQDYETNIWRQDGGEPVAVYRTSWHRFERDSAEKASKYKGRELAHYEPEDIERIKADYAKEKRWGDTPHYWEDVTVGEELPFVVKGPTTQASKFAFESWSGASGWFVGHRQAFELFEKHPGLPFINEQGIPEVPVAIHWSNERSQRLLGLPGAYEAGYERTSWIVHLLMNYASDYGFLRRLTQKFPTFSLLGDTTWCRGRVENKRLGGHEGIVEIDVRTVNQRGDVTTTGIAEVVLPLRAETLAVAASRR